MKRMRGVFVFGGLAVVVMLTLICGGIPVIQAYAQEDAEEKTVEFGELETQVIKMQDDINTAITALEQVSEDSHEERIARLEDFLVVAEDSLGKLQEGGDLYETLMKAIAKTEEAKGRNEENSENPDVPQETREKYAGLVEILTEDIEGLYEKKTMIEGERAKLEKNIKSWQSEKDFIAELILINKLDKANDALSNVFNSVKGVNESMEAFANKMLDKEPPPKPED